MENVKIDVKPEVRTAMAACVTHAHALLASAKAVQTAGHPNIAYHLAALCLEELGRRSLLGVQTISEKATVPPAWPKKHEQDHIKKLFWAIFGASFLGERITAEKMREMSGVATHIHETRLLGLYVGTEEDGLTIPAEQIGNKDADNLISLAEARLGMADGDGIVDEAPQELIDLQAWLVTTFDDPEKRKQVLSSGSLEKLAELKDVRGWARWLKELFDKAEADGRLAAEREIERSRSLPSKKTKDKWQMRIRIVGASHSIRPKVLNAWNDKSDWIKLSTTGKKDELLIDLILGDNVPIHALWYFAWGVVRQFVVALNIGSMGFWWWHMPEHIDSFYESIRDLESGETVKLSRQPSLRIDWGAGRVLTIEDLGRVAAVFAHFSARDPNGEPTGLDHYIGGLTFLALNDVHWQCEVQAFGNFYKSLKAMLKQHGDWLEGQPFVPAFLKLIDELFPALDERQRFADIVEAFEGDKLEGVVITLKEVSFIKLFCDAYFLKRLPKFVPPVIDNAEPSGTAR